LVTSAALATALWLRPLRPVALVALAVALVFAVFDIAEVGHQIDESRTGLAVLAAVVATGHLAAGGASGRVGWFRASQDHLV
jgi:hypothetical protein